VLYMGLKDRALVCSNCSTYEFHLKKTFHLVMDVIDHRLKYIICQYLTKSGTVSHTRVL